MKTMRQLLGKVVVRGSLALFLTTFLWARASWAQAPASEEAAPGEEAPAEEAQDQVEETLKSVQHEVVKANTLWDLAEFYYKNPWLWPRIYEANKDKIKNPHWIYPGQVFLIPGLNKMVTVVKRAPGQPPAQVEEPQAAEEPAPPSEPAPQDEGPADGFSKELPPGMTGQRPAVFRTRLPHGWKADGRVIEFKGREVLAAQGDTVWVRLDAPDVQKGQRYVVYRLGAPTEDDPEEKVIYAQNMGTVEVVQRVARKKYAALILRSGDGLQLDDLLKKE